MVHLLIENIQNLIQSGGFMTDISGITSSLDNVVNQIEFKRIK